MVSNTIGSFVAGSTPSPPFLRKSRFVGSLSHTFLNIDTSNSRKITSCAKPAFKVKYSPRVSHAINIFPKMLNLTMGATEYIDGSCIPQRLEVQLYDSSGIFLKSRRSVVSFTYLVYSTRLTLIQLSAYKVPADSALRRTAHPLFWTVRSSDVGAVRSDTFQALAISGKINIIPSVQAVGYSNDGKSVILGNGEEISAKVVVLGTGYQSSWSSLFSCT